LKFVAALLLIHSAGLAHSADPPEARQKELSHLVRQDCGSCHGMAWRVG
jgi:cytochrome c55X